MDSRPPSVVAQVDLRQLPIEADLRRHDAALAVAFLRGDPEHRWAAAWGLARIGADPVVPMLSRGLTDPHPEVRAAASFGLGLLGLPLDSWIGAAVAEADPDAAGAMLEDLGRAVNLQRAGLLVRALEGDQPKHACLGITHLLERDPELPAPTVNSLLRLADHRDPETARACLRALTMLPPSALAPVARVILDRTPAGLSADDPLRQRLWLRLAATQGAGATPHLLTAAAGDHPALAAEAVETLALTRAVGLATWTAQLEPRLTRLLAGAGTAADPSVLHAGLEAAPHFGDSAELVAWLTSVVERLAPVPDHAPPANVAGLHFASARALDRVRQWPSRTVGCGGGAIAAWVGQSAAADVLGRAQGSDPLRATQLRRLFDTGDWHVRQAVMLALQGVEPALGLPLLVDGLSHDHPEVQAAAAETIALLAPRLRTATQSLPGELADPLRRAFQAFHVKDHARGLRAFLAVVRMARLRAELGPVTVLARSGIAAVRLDARSLLDEWGHPQPAQGVDPVPEPLSRDALLQGPIRVGLSARGRRLTLTFDPQAAPVTVARLIRWLQQRPPLEVTDLRAARHLLLTPADGLAPGPWRNEESRTPIRRGTVVMPPRARDATQASLLILLADAPELEGRVTVVGQVSEGLALLEPLSLGETLTVTGP